MATEACRIARNGRDFLRRVEQEVGLKLEVLDRETEASLAVSGCASLIDYRADYVLVFDIGGGSSELIWLDLASGEKSRRRCRRGVGKPKIGAWTSLPVGVVTLAERFGGHDVTPDVFENMVAYVLDLVRPFEALHGLAARAASGNMHLLGTSGTVTTVAGIHLGLKRYDRARVDGCWLAIDEMKAVTYSLLAHSYEERVARAVHRARARGPRACGVRDPRGHPAHVAGGTLARRGPRIARRHSGDADERGRRLPRGAPAARGRDRGSDPCA